MNVRRWIARWEPNWKQLETLLKKVKKKGISKLTADEVRQIASLYRSVSADLARWLSFDWLRIVAKNIISCDPNDILKAK